LLGIVLNKAMHSILWSKPMKFYQQMPIEPYFVEFIALICKFDMVKTIEKWKLQWEGREVAHILLVEPMWFHSPFLNFIPIEWDHSKNCCKKLQHSQWARNEENVKS